MSVARDVKHGAVHLAAKRRFGAMIDAIGGLGRTIELSGTRVGQTQISAYQGINTDTFAPIDVVMDIEAVCPEGPLVTAFMAKRAGHVLVKLPDGSTSVGDYLSRMGALMRGTGALSVGITTAVADRRIDPRERGRIMADLDALIEDAVGLRLMLENERDG